MLGSFKVNVPFSEDTLPWGKELIFRNGLQAGYVTSANFGFSVGKPICMGYVNCDSGNISTEYLKKGKYEIEIDGIKWPAELNLRGPYDPNSFKMKS